MKTAFPTIVLACLASVAASMDYQECFDVAKTDPDKALADAKRWAREGGGAAAEHCASVALVELGAFAAAARMLDTLAEKPGAGDPGTRAQLLTQAGGLWLEAGATDAAFTSLDAALRLDPTSPDALATRAEALMTDGRPSEAANHLTAAMENSARSPSLLSARSAALLAAGDAAGALRDADDALALEANSPDALYQRGAALAKLGRTAEARKALLDSIEAGRGGPVEIAARTTLEDMEAQDAQ